jgi:hypothetical protein
MKACFKCGAEKPRAAFYAHPKMSDGLLGKCKDCTRLDVRANRLAHLDRIREYDNRRAKTPEGRARRTAGTRAWRQKHPGRSAAHLAAQRAAKVAPLRCRHCGEDRRLERHHPDYSNPRLVMWLCKPCHALADAIRRRIEAF